MIEAGEPVPESPASTDSGFTIQSVAAPLIITTAIFTTIGMLNQMATHTLVDRLGGSERYVGFSLAAVTTGAVAGRLVGGSVVDRFGEQRGFRVAAFVLILGGIALAIPVSIASFLIGRFVHGIGEAVSYTASATMVMNRTPANRRSRLLGLLGSGVWGGISVGTALGEWVGRSEWTGAIVILIAVLMVWFGSRLGSPDPLPGVARRHAFAVRFPRPALVPSLSIGFYNAAYAAITSYVILHLQDNGINPAGALSAYAVAVLCGRLVLGGLPDRLGPRPSLIAGLSAMFAGLGIVAWAPGRVAVLGALALFGLGYSMPFPALASVAVDRTTESDRASTIATLGMVYDIFVFMSGVLFGAIAHEGHHRPIMLLGMAGIAIGFMLAMATTRATGSRRGDVAGARR